ncbi:MAG: sulfonate transport system ATP-binding protein [Myxococcales bacterium]|jgi:ABC-type nitrate/sulfonate/bicarbonate transport system ATPase subunit|nr:sulfonate transport system ATP-binding protein [Myxococcales bacterium]
MSRLAFSGVTKTYRTRRDESVTALASIDLELGDGELVCLVGRSGCGKTTLLRIAAGVEVASAGAVLLDGARIEGPSPAIGMVFQEDRLLPWRSVQANVELGLEIAHVAAPKRRVLAARALELVDLKGFAAAYPNELSGGMRQRAAIARALVNEPGVILLDEPFGALDAETRTQMQRELLRLRAAIGSTVLFVTHSVDEAVVLADRVVVLSPRPGRIHGEFRIEAPHPRDVSATDLAEQRRAILEALGDAG